MTAKRKGATTRILLRLAQKTSTFHPGPRRREHAGIKRDRRTSIRGAYDSGLTSAALELGENEICKGFTFSCV